MLRLNMLSGHIRPAIKLAIACFGIWLSSASFAQDCIDDDGDGWGWSNGQSCLATETTVPVTTQTDNQPATTASQPLTSSGAGLNINQLVCEIATNASSCDVIVKFNEPGNGPHCLFQKNDWLSTQAELITCGSPTQVRITGITSAGKTLELRQGSMLYEMSTLVDRRSVTGISGIERGQFQRRDTRQPAVLKNTGASSLTTTWDGRISFDAVRGGNNKLVSVVRMFRPERLDGQSAAALENRQLFSNGHIFSSDAMSRNEVAQSGVSVPGDLGNNTIGIDVPFNIAVHPNNNFTTNPYRSDRDGSASSRGQYETYRLYAIMGASRAGSIEGQFDVANGRPERGKKFFLTKTDASVVVSNPRTINADVSTVIIHSAARPLRDTNGQLIYGYEPSVTLDGRLIVFSGNSNPSRRNGNGGEISYIFQQDQHSYNSWSPQRNLAELYLQHGSGNPAGETRINGRAFSEHFPIASFPIRQYNGETMGRGDFVKGAYPWISPRGSETFFQARATFHGPARSGASVVGYRTNGQLWHMDGDINNNRGNPTDRYDHWSNGTGSNNQYQAISRAYENRRFPGTNTTMGPRSWSTSFIRLVGQFPTSWNATAELNQSPLPLNPFFESYGFWLTGNRYFEFSFPPYADDLIAYYPMNEPLYQNQSVIRAHMNASPADPGSETVRRTSVVHVIDRTADLSGHQQTATLLNGAKYPFEHYDVKNVWANSGVLRDQSEGAYGNSIFLPVNGRLLANLSSRSMNNILNTQSFSTSLWFNSNTYSAPTRLIEVAGLFSISVHQNRITATVENDSRQRQFNASARIQNNRWHHVAVVWNFGKLQIFLDGIEIHSETVNGEIQSHSVQATALTIGPAGEGAPNLLLKMDEVYLYSAQLTDDDITTLSLRNKIYSNPQNSFFVSSGMATDYPGQSSLTDKSFNANGPEVNLGEALFNSTRLSRDNTLSCASCHQEAREFTDGQIVSTGINNTTGTLNTPTITNALLSKRFFYRGSASSLETQAIHTIMHNGEMGVADVNQIVNTLPESIRTQFRSVYQREPNLSDLSRALAAYVKTIRVTGSLDQISRNLTAEAQRGERIFNGKANCIACHSGTNLTDNQFHDIGLNGSTSDRSSFTSRQNDQFRHKTPGLRNIALTAPYFHDGSAADLQAVIRHYNDRSHVAAGRVTDPLLHPLELSQNEIDDLVAYLFSLNGTTVTK